MFSGLSIPTELQLLSGREEKSIQTSWSCGVFLLGGYVAVTYPRGVVTVPSIS